MLPNPGGPVRAFRDCRSSIVAIHMLSKLVEVWLFNGLVLSNVLEDNGPSGLDRGALSLHIVYLAHFRRSVYNPHETDI